MGIIEATRLLGVEIQKDERFIRFIKAKLANDNDETLQNQIGEFNTVRMNLDREMNSETQDEEKIKAKAQAAEKVTPASDAVKKAQTAIKSMQQQTAKAVKEIQERTAPKIKAAVPEKKAPAQVPPKEEK